MLIWKDTTIIVTLEQSDELGNQFGFQLIKILFQVIFEYLNDQSEKEKWSQPFLDYFQKHLKCDVERSAKYQLIEKGLYTEHSGVTTNTSEAMNTVYKRVQDWQEVSIDSLVFSFHLLANYYKIGIGTKKDLEKMFYYESLKEIYLILTNI